jgi:hypothetical protein
LPFLSEYYDRKIEAEKFIMEECGNIKPCLLRPGFIVDGEHRSWSVPLGQACNILFLYNEMAKKVPVVGPATDFLFPAKPTRLATVGHFAYKGALGEIDHPIVHN